MIKIRMLIAIIAERKLLVHQLDVKTAFLQSILKNPVYMKPPDGIKYCPPNYLCKLKKALYGLRESPKSWNDCINYHLVNMNLIQSKLDPFLYFNENMFLLIWVDDMLLISKSLEVLENTKRELGKRIELRYLSNENVKSDKIYFLGIEIVIKNTEVIISQKEMIQKVLKKFNMVNCTPISIPIQPKLCLQKGENCNNKYPYKECLMYIMLGTRPDLCYAVTFFSMFQTCFDVCHWKLLKNVLRYLKGTEHYEIKYRKSNDQNMMLHAYVDADYANDINDRKSITGFVLKMNNNIIFWKSKK